MTSFPILPNGSWACSTKDPHSFDRPLAAAIGRLLIEYRCQTVADLGCGSGAYTEFFHGLGLTAVGFDGNPHTPEFSKHCFVRDLTQPMDISPDWVVSLETGEHVPQDLEQRFLDNVAKATRGVVLSWYPDADGQGDGHVNPRDTFYIHQQMVSRGFFQAMGHTMTLRQEASLWWFKKSVACFTKPAKSTGQTCPTCRPRV
jgi:hypothetical protein